MDFAFAVFKLVMGLWYRSYWLMAVAIYYITLSVMRFILLFKERERRKYELEELKRVCELKSYRFCGGMMIFLIITMWGMLIQMIWHGKGYRLYY